MKDGEKPSEIESRIVSLKIQKKTLSEKYRQISLAAECLETASENMKKTAAPRISGRAGELFSNITDGKYRGLYTDGEMRLSFMENGQAKVYDAQYLSAGTLDLAYICLRTALCEYLYAERPTLIFDDAFAHMDSERLKKTLDFLCELSEKFQIIILTCHEREVEYLNRRAKIIGF